MKKITFLIAILMFACHMQSCATNIIEQNTRIVASKNYVTKQLFFDDFSSISLRGSANITFTQRPGKPEVTVTTSDNIIDILETYVEDNTLTIGYKKGYKVQNAKTRIDIKAASLNDVEMVGSGSFNLENKLNTDDLRCHIAGSGDININNGLTVKNVSATVAGSGSINYSNIDCEETASFSIAGSGDANGNGIKCKLLNSYVAGSGDFYLTNIEAENVDSKISGSGDFYLSGKAQNATLGISGSGSIEAKDLQANDVNIHISGSGDVTCHANHSLEVSRSGSGSVNFRGNPEVQHFDKKYVHHIE